MHHFHAPDHSEQGDSRMASVTVAQPVLATILTFPTQCACPCCGRPCGEDELSACYTCGEKSCGSAKSDCKSVCACDRLALYLQEVREIRKPGWLARLWMVAS